MTRNYRVFTGTELLNDFNINQVCGYTVYDHQSYVFDPDAKHSEIYGPFSGRREALTWCENSNKLFRELEKELCNVQKA